ncbi:hypothetical protein LCGC14_2385740 [marine sediment metagenome]|uniref:Uncharacterized protein n=1 Tax=marine sediment metagenome TaxID=412755 RepID=A0A0F9BZR6_9ZZZZ
MQDPSNCFKPTLPCPAHWSLDPHPRLRLLVPQSKVPSRIRSSFTQPKETCFLGHWDACQPISPRKGVLSTFKKDVWDVLRRFQGRRLSSRFWLFFRLSQLNPERCRNFEKMFIIYSFFHLPQAKKTFHLTTVTFALKKGSLLLQTSPFSFLHIMTF